MRIIVPAASVVEDEDGDYYYVDAQGTSHYLSWTWDDDDNKVYYYYGQGTNSYVRYAYDVSVFQA